MAEGRDERGRFTQGHRYSVGNKGGRPSRVVEEATFTALAKKYSNGHLSTMMEQLAGATDKGDLTAIKLVLSYLLGMPVQRSEIGADDDLADLLRQWRGGGSSESSNDDSAENNG